MSAADFPAAFAALLGNEGGYADNPADPGGETMHGITARVARVYGYTGAMRDLPLETARAIAKADYWDIHRCDEMPAVIAFQVFDAAYNGGPANRWLQQAAGVTADGLIGPATLAAVNAADPYRLIARFDAERLLYLASLPAWPSFGRGWARRIATNLLRGMA